MGQKQSTMGSGKSRESNSIGDNIEPVTDPASASSPASPQAEPEQKAIDLSVLQKKITVTDPQASIISYLGNRYLAECSNRNRLFNKALQPELTLRRLMHHVARGEHDKDNPSVQAILTANPELLLQKSHTIDLSGRSFTGLSPWQLVWCNADYDMVTKMKAYTHPSTLDQQLMADQLHELFQGGYDAHLAQQSAAESVFDFGAIVEAIDRAGAAQLESAINLEGAILPATYAFPQQTNEGVACTLTTALNAFRQAFTRQSLNEQIFNPQHLLKALEIYSHRYNDWSYGQRRVFWSQVVGFAQRFMPSCYTQAFVQGLYYLAEESSPVVVKRSLSVSHGGCSISSDRGGSGLGFKFGLPAGGGLGSPVRSVASFAFYRFQKQYQTKTGCFADLYQNPCSRSSQALSQKSE